MLDTARLFFWDVCEPLSAGADGFGDDLCGFVVASRPKPSRLPALRDRLFGLIAAASLTASPSAALTADALHRASAASSAQHGASIDVGGRTRASSYASDASSRSRATSAAEHRASASAHHGAVSAAEVRALSPRGLPIPSDPSRFPLDSLPPLDLLPIFFRFPSDPFRSLAIPSDPLPIPPDPFRFPFDSQSVPIPSGSLPTSPPPPPSPLPP